MGKGNKIFFILFILMLLLYMVSQYYKPKQFEWNVTLQNDDKNPFGTYLLFHQLKDLFPNSEIKNVRVPVYNNLENQHPASAAYILIENEFDPGETDRNALFAFVRRGNIAFIASSDGNALLDSLGLDIGSSKTFPTTDSTSINFTNPALKSGSGYTFLKGTIDFIFDSIRKPSPVTVLGTNEKGDPNFLKIRFGQGYFLWHAAPIAFSNYFLLKNNNSDYVSKALSYLPETVNTIYWDEYYKSGREGPSTPLRFFLSDPYLRWALYIAAIGLLIYVLFEVKRKQRIIPVIESPKNASLDFVETVAAVYFSQHDNKAIAQKKSNYWFEFVRRRYKLLNFGSREFPVLLEKRSGVPSGVIEDILASISRSKAQPVVTDDLLLNLNHLLDKFYELTKSPIHGNKE